MRLIDADALSTKINKIGYIPVCVDCMTKHNVIEIVEQQPTIEPNQWVPCSERLPEDIDENLIECYLLTDGFLIWMAYYKSNIGRVFAECTNSDKIIDWTEITAWQPLLQPYTPN